MAQMIERVLTRKEVDAYKRQFEEFDNDGSGTISTDELMHLLKAMGGAASEAEIRAMLKEVDVDGSGDVDLPEFLHMVAKAQRAQLPAEYRSNISRKRRLRDEKERAGQEERFLSKEQVLEFRAAFRAFDADGSGTISTEELAVVVRDLHHGDGKPPSDEEIARMVARVDINNDGQIDAHEFVSMMAASLGLSVPDDYERILEETKKEEVFGSAAHPMMKERRLHLMDSASKSKNRLAHNLQTYLSVTGIHASFKEIIVELLETRPPAGDAFTYMAARLREIGRQRAQQAAVKALKKTATAPAPEEQ